MRIPEGVSVCRSLTEYGTRHAWTVSLGHLRYSGSCSTRYRRHKQIKKAIKTALAADECLSLLKTTIQEEISKGLRIIEARFERRLSALEEAMNENTEDPEK